ncbi:MAG TPA: response regulator [Thermodesulfobacteriota bacterium]|nr:response regulator [Thermodesulfobacteriota bacterium]
MRKEKVLIVEDEMDLLDLVDFNLTREGFVTAGALDGSEALEKIESFAPDLVVLDLMLPKMDGWKICEGIKSRNRDVAVIMLTAKSMPEDKVKGLECGADDYITKPFNIRELVLKIESHLENKRGKDLRRMLVHEVTNRLSAIGCYSELLLKKESKIAGEREPDFLRTIKEQIDCAAEFVSEVGALTEIESGTRRLELEDCDIGKTVRLAAESFRGAAEKRGIAMAVEVGWEVPEVRASRFALKQIFANLIGNAVKYNRPNGSIAVSVKGDPNGVLVSVKDSGAGIPPDAMPHIFKKGFRAANAGPTTKGSGLGLYIVKTLADRLGASLSYGSVEGEGSAFAVYFESVKKGAAPGATEKTA